MKGASTEREKCRIWGKLSVLCDLSKATLEYFLQLPHKNVCFIPVKRESWIKWRHGRKKHWRSVERQSCSRERILKSRLAQRNDRNKGAAVLSLIRGGEMRCRQQSPKRDYFTSQTEKHTLFPLRWLWPLCALTDAHFPFLLHILIIWPHFHWSGSCLQMKPVWLSSTLMRGRLCRVRRISRFRRDGKDNKQSACLNDYTANMHKYHLTAWRQVSFYMLLRHGSLQRLNENWDLRPWSSFVWLLVYGRCYFLFLTRLLPAV